MLMKEIKESKWKDIPCSWIGTLNTIKLLILPKSIYRVNTILNKITLRFFSRYKKDYFKAYIKRQRN